ncbi:MAG TPA: hypothetical protein VIQ29_25465 [Ancylobacter sp.]
MRSESNESNRDPPRIRQIKAAAVWGQNAADRRQRVIQCVVDPPAYAGQQKGRHVEPYADNSALI